jgi:TonB family protein
MKRTFLYALIFIFSSIGFISSFDCSRPVGKSSIILNEIDSPYDSAPSPKRLIKPIYPPDAFRAGISGKVWVSVLIDTSGNVAKAIIYKDSGKNAGFETATLDAAFKTQWKPATFDAKPLAVWVTYKIDFSIK